MTHDSSLLNSIRPVDPPVRVLTADGTPSQSLVEVFLVLSRFMFLLLCMFLSLTCSSFLVVRSSTLVVASLSTLIPVLFKIVAPALCLVLAPDAMMASGSLTGFVFLSSASVAAATSSFQQWHHRLGYLCGSRLSSLVHRGVLGSVFGNASLDCLGCRLGKQIQLPYPHNESVSERPFDLVHSDV
jgi:hypothetical protein